MHCAKEEAPGDASEGRDSGIGRTVVEADCALFGIAPNPGDNGEGTNGVNVMLDTTEEGGE